MPIAYYGSQISPNMTETPEGFLICHEVPINRVGIYKYLGSDLMQPESGTEEDKAKAREFNKLIEPFTTYNVLRRPEEVFSPGALASFEGKSVTDNHPPENVTPDNYGIYEKGHAEHVHEGTGKDRGYTVADLVIKDRGLIDEIKNGKRDISCGYLYNIYRNPNGQFEQKSIRGNHIAVVDKGRAGPRVAIKDSKTEIHERGKNMAAENKGSLKGRIMKILGRDESISPEDLEKVSKMEEPEKGKEPVAEDENPDEMIIKNPLEKGGKEESKDDSPEAEMFAKILECLQHIETSLAPKESEDDLDSLIHPEHEEEESPGEEAEEHEKEAPGSESSEEQEPKVTVAPEEIQKKAAADAALVKEILKSHITDPKEFKAAAKDAATSIRNAYGIRHSNQGYSDFIKATSAAGKKRYADDASCMNNQGVYADQQKLYDALNPHKNKEAK